MLDKQLPYAEVWMTRPLHEELPSYPLNEQYRFETYQPGAEQDWAIIETAIGEFDSVEKALAYFEKAFAPYPEELAKRMYFVVDEQNERIATCTAWWKLREKEYPLFHWLAVKPEHQGKGIARSLTIEVLRCFQQVTTQSPIYLHTQTWSHPAIKLYQSLGFTFIPEKFDGSVNPEYQKVLEILSSKIKK
ncbi:GNAT family N-acetyltransferase [Enterococcus mundtii]